MLWQFFDDEFSELEREVHELKEENKQLRWLLKCKDDPKLCPCGGYRGDYHSHATDCKVINPYGRGRDYSRSD